MRAECECFNHKKKARVEDDEGEQQRESQFREQSECTSTLFMLEHMYILREREREGESSF